MLNEEKQKLKIENLMSMPLDSAYSKMLSPLRFQYMSMKKDETGKDYLGHY